MSSEEESSQPIPEDLPEYEANPGIIVEVIEPRCYWCGKAQPEIKELLESRYQKKNQEEIEIYLSCTQEHESKTQKFLNFNERFYFLYIAFMFVFPVILLTLALIISKHIFSIGFSLFISMGIGLLIMPLLGNQLVKNIGLKRSLLLGRIIGVILVIIGVALILTFGQAFFG
ncbi:MAG: hypothetical protein KGD59_07125 [Candidatus Heimdallarchaeota archaeon]|nr:hypothetical protein [Candidatus Heimdallarchaeota archaeon]MBY8994305.1 hypothetical protein [Candidatus Heimdallarchaeota archaeon]